MKPKIRDWIAKLRNIGQETVRLWLQAAAFFVSAAALVWGAYGLYEQRKWDREHFAVQMINQWNAYSNEHKAAIEAAYPELFQHESNPELRKSISYQEAQCIYNSTPQSDPVRWETRNHCIALLNYFEFVTAAWDSEIADHKVIEDSFKSTILRWHRDLEQFMIVMRETRRYEPWPPLQRVVTIWKDYPAPRPNPYPSPAIQVVPCTPRPTASPSPINSPKSELSSRTL